MSFCMTICLASRPLILRFSCAPIVLSSLVGGGWSVVEAEGSLGGVYWAGGGIPVGLLITVLKPIVGAVAKPTGGIPVVTELARDGTATPTGG